MVLVSRDVLVFTGGTWENKEATQSQQSVLEPETSLKRNTKLTDRTELNMVRPHDHTYSSSLRGALFVHDAEALI